jgi:hypothetical protein
MKKIGIEYEAAKGNYWQNYIGEVGEWVKVSYLKYWWLKIRGYKVRKNENNTCNINHRKTNVK